MDNETDQIDHALKIVEKASEEKRLIPASVLERWMKTDDLAIRGIAVDMILEHPELIEALPPHKTDPFLLSYFESAIRQNPQNRFAYSRYAAGRALQMLFFRLWEQRDTSNVMLAKLRDLLSELSKNGDRDIQNAIVTGILEHLFVNPEIVEFFGEWRNDSILKQLFSDARSMAGKV